MNEEIIGIEVSGEIHPIKDEETSEKAQTLGTKVSIAEANITNLENAVKELEKLIDDTTTSSNKTWSSEKINNSLMDKDGREQLITFPFTPTVNGTLIITIGQNTASPVVRGVNVKENGEAFYHINNYFGGSWGASSASMPLIKGRTYTVDDMDNVINYEKTKFIY